MMILKKKEIVAAALVVLIGVAGYLNWSYQDTIRVTDGEIYTETGKKLGEAQYVNATTEAEEKPDKKKEEQKEDKEEKKEPEQETAPTSGDYFAESKMEKENSRSKSLEILNRTASNEDFDDEIREKAQNQILQIADNIETESMLEKVAQAKGFDKLTVYIDNDSVKLIVKKDNLSEQDISKLKDLIVEHTQTPPQNIKIVEMK
ncbi:MAG: SpoIIIAH-like family protein [Ruminococcaceae bacterium]|nr:SpoIIIAH-like family protein [Oscillospiraceae bacterium]